MQAEEELNLEAGAALGAAPSYFFAANRTRPLLSLRATSFPLIFG